ncbi:hypothetical protein KR222_005222 [Zaprionus bogoriensis]|nr:hypothetical protein KR222_005222 [Zaprionus bogoriensis]
MPGITYYQILAAFILLGIQIYVCAYPEYEVNYAIFQNKDHPNKCYVETDGKPLLIGIEQVAPYPGRCANIFCGRDSWALVYICDRRTPPPGCVFEKYTDPEALFPDCCDIDWKCNNIKP